MPTFPPFKTKPYYESLKSWLFTSHNEDGTLRSDAVQAEVAAAIANTDTYVAAADDAIAAELASNPNLAAVNSPGAEGEALTVVGGVPDWAPVPSVAAVTALQASASRLESRVATYSVHDPASGTVAVGDGVTDDYAAIQARLDGLPTSPNEARGGKVELAPGHVYGISQTLEITLPNTDLDGIVGGTLTNLGSCTIKALPGFTGPLLRVNIPSGSKGAWIRNLRLDGNLEPGVTAGVEYAYGTISVAHMFDVAIYNTVEHGIKTNRNCQSIVMERVLAAFGMRVGMEIGPDMRHLVVRDSRIGGTQYGVIIGPDNSLGADSVETAIFDGCEIYAIGTADAVAPVLVRNAENPRFLNCYIEVSASANAITSLVQLGTANAVTRTPVVTGCRLGGNAKASYGVDVVNAYYPFVAYNGTDTNITTALVREQNAQTAIARRGFMMGGNGNNPDWVLSQINSHLPSGYDGIKLYREGEAQATVQLRNNASGGGALLLGGGGSKGPDVVFYRRLPNQAALGPGDSLWLDGAWNSSKVLLGNYHLWVDATGALRIKDGAPASDTDGTVVGTQT